MKNASKKRFDEFFLQVVDYSSAKEYADQLGIPFLETSVRPRIIFSDPSFTFSHFAY
jgi:hypothetical protein